MGLTVPSAAKVLEQYGKKGGAPKAVRQGFE